MRNNTLTRLRELYEEAGNLMADLVEDTGEKLPDWQHLPDMKLEREYALMAFRDFLASAQAGRAEAATGIAVWPQFPRKEIPSERMAS
ncbi:hypothetical protein FJU08_01225 [Martelella alba]|uniref:Uncharacterized protein n=1 Tax=Martelella alba TaxID=2590451 RepID=A0A506UIR6_9HYPH|nr:hypothetical protein [Martelella alba]TPW33215.1 hypothetical protein FJU08_01225 [Martelella alba]